MLVQALINGVLVGAVWAVLGLGKQIVLGVIHFVNFAHGHLVMLAMYLGLLYWTITHADPFLLLPLVVVSLALIGWVLDRVMVRRLVDLGDRSQMIATLALALIIENAALLIAGPEPRSVRSWASSSALEIGGVFLNWAQLIGLGIAVIAFVGTWWLLNRTPLGAMIRATSQNRESAQYMGIDISRVYGYAFALSVSLAGVVGAILIVSTPVGPQSAWSFLVLMFVVPVLGGLGSIGGTALAGVIVGMLQVLSTEYLDIQLQNAVVYAAFLAFLLVRPQGIFGRSTDQYRVSV